MSAPFVHELRVRYGECDPQGIVFNANYLLYFDVAFTDLGRTSVTTEIDVVRDGLVLVEGRLRHVTVETSTWGKTELPDWVRDGLRSFAVS